MSLHGKIGTMSIPEILQWVGMGKKSGVLSFYNRGTSKNLYFEDGYVISASSNNPRDYLGQFLISAGKITEEDLKKAFITQQETNILLGKILCMIGKIKEEELQAILKRKIEETVYDLFLWTEGDFSFSEMTGTALKKKDLQIVVKLGVNELIMEGARRYDEWRRMKKKFADLEMVVRPLKDLHPERYAPGSKKRKLLELLKSEKTLRELSLELRADEVNLLQIIDQLQEAGFIEVVPGPEPYGKKPLDPALFKGDWRKNIKQLLVEQRYEEAILYLDELIHLEDEPQELKEIRRKLETRYTNILKNYLKPLDRVPVLNVSAEEIAKHQLTAEEGFIISRVNGEWDVDTIVGVSPLPTWVTMQILKKFHEQGFIRFREG